MVPRAECPTSVIHINFLFQYWCIIEAVADPAITRKWGSNLALMRLIYRYLGSNRDSDWWGTASSYSPRWRPQRQINR